MTEAVEDFRPRMPRVVAAIVIGAIGLAALAALLFPSLPIANLFSGPTNVAVIRALVPDPAARPAIGEPAPNFQWNGPDGTTKTLTDLRGKPVVITFWATWCEPCRREMPAMQRVAGSTDAVFLAVDLLEDGARVRGFMDSLAVDRLMPLLDTDGAVTRAYSAIELPETFFVNAQGVIAHIERGELDEAGVRAGIAKAR
ncbi:MAG TPA: TlpA disulfide reductase family protein [Candidatus Acidoferrales bacterium]|nr:TlpA disulfide reductase family protein [Candidatus Acidoferrales bacterium]